MPQGEEYLADALARCRQMAEQIATLEQGDEAWRSDVGERLSAVTDLLQSMEGRFFLRSKLCLPFARRCAEEAKSLEETLGRAEATGQVDQGLQALELAARTLDERSQMQGMSIT
jgi:phage shock protein A